MIKDNSRFVEGVMNIDLTSPEGNAGYLLNTARRLSRRFGYDMKKITNEMKAEDYENLVKVFDSYFGDYVTLYR